MSLIINNCFISLFRFGVFTSSDQLNPCTILKRFCRTQYLFGIRETLNQPTANITFYDFENTFLKFCIKHQLFNLMFTCFEDSEFPSDRVQALCSASDFREEESDWFRLWLIMIQMNGTFTDESLVYQAVNEATRYLSKGNIDSYLQQHPLVVVATIIFGKKTLRDVVESEDSSDFPIKRDTCLSALKQLPFLELALSSQKYPSRKQDVTVYQLLQDSSPFDVSKLFGWQSVHTYVILAISILYCLFKARILLALLVQSDPKHWVTDCIIYKFKLLVFSY